MTQRSPTEPVHGTVTGPRPGEPVYGTSWRRHGPRRSRAARIARLLRPVAHLLGGLVSAEIVVRREGRWYRPDVGVLLGDDGSLDGALARAPTLVVCLGGPLTGADWLAAGADVVWEDHGVAAIERTRKGARHLYRGAWLTHPGEPALRLAADDVAARALPETRDAVDAVDARISA